MGRPEKSTQPAAPVRRQAQDSDVKKPMNQNQERRPSPLLGTAPTELLWTALKLVGALGLALALATWVNSLLAQI